MTSPFDLRPYQREAALAVGKCLAENPAGRPIVVLPTRCGKTVMGLYVAAGIGRTLWVAHTQELIDQPYRTARALMPGKEIGVVKAGLDHVGARDLVIASIQTLYDARRDRLVEHQRYSGPFRFVVCDEGHHAVAGSAYERLLDALPGVPALALTATPERTDKRPIGKVFRDGVVYRYPVAVAIREGWLVPAVSRQIRLPDFDPSKIPTNGNGDLNEKELEKALLRAHAARAIGETIAEAVAEGRKPVAFTISVEQAEESAKVARSLGVKCEAISGETPKSERDRVLKAHRDNEIQAVVNCAVLLEGYDDQSIDAIVWGRPTKSRPLFIQGAGRGLGCSPLTGKKDCVIYDLVGAYPAHGLQTSDQVFGEEPEKPPEDGGDVEKRLLCACEHADDEHGAEGIEDAIGRLACTKCPCLAFTEKPKDDGEAARLRNFLSYLSGARELDGQTTESSVKWLVAVRNQCIALTAGEEGTVLVEAAPNSENLPLWNAVLEPRDHRAAPSLLTDEPTTLEIAQTVGENYARSVGSFRLAARDAAWRRREPSEKMIAMLDRFHVQYRDDVTAGQASDLLTMSIAAARFKSRGRRPPEPRAAPVMPQLFWSDL